MNRALRGSLIRILRKKYAGDERGTTSIEYALIAALISVVILIGLNALSGEVNNLFNYFSTKVTDALP
jgi:Flp pilus assembly pilin Flp